MNTEQQNTQGHISGESPSSKIDLFSGKHTSSLVVAILFIVVFIGLITYLVFREKYENIVINGFFSLLSLLAGFFAGSNARK